MNKWPLLHNYQRYVQFPLLCQCGATDNNLKVQTSLRERVMLSKGESAIDVTMKKLCPYSCIFIAWPEEAEAVDI